MASSNSPWVFFMYVLCSLLVFSLAPSLSHLSLRLPAWLFLGEASSLCTFRPFVSPSTLGSWCAPPCHFQSRHPNSTMDNMHDSLKAPRDTTSLDYFAGQGQQDSEKDCFGCQRLRIHLGAINSTMTFELETLSQHRHLIERLHDEVFAQRSQIEDQRSQMENMQGCLDQMENNYKKPNTPDNTQEASKNLSTTTVNQVLDLNEPTMDANWEQHEHPEVKKESGS